MGYKKDAAPSNNGGSGSNDTKGDDADGDDHTDSLDGLSDLPDLQKKIDKGQIGPNGIPNSNGGKTRIGTRPLNGPLGSLYGTGMFQTLTYAHPFARAFRKELALMDDKYNTEFHHEHLFHDDGTNIGFGSEGPMENEDVNDYDLQSETYDTNKVKDNIKDVDKDSYSLIGNNCQDYTDIATGKKKRKK